MFHAVEDAGEVLRRLLLVNAVGIGVQSLLQVVAIVSAENGRVDASGVAVVLDGVWPILFVVTAAAFIAWARRCYANLDALGGTRARAPHWLIWSWFVPFVNLYVPYKMVQEIHWGSTGGDPNVGFEDAPPPINDKILRAWWALWIAGGWLSTRAARLDWDTHDGMSSMAGATLTLASDLMFIACALLVMNIVRDITAGQSSLARMMRERDEIDYVEVAQVPLAIPACATHLAGLALLMGGTVWLAFEPSEWGTYAAIGVILFAGVAMFVGAAMTLVAHLRSSAPRPIWVPIAWALTAAGPMIGLLLLVAMLVFAG